jgi:phthalate 4,5-dioxygenase oxygenase subunit
MLSPQDNETLCRISPGTPMGNLVRQYWVPALMSTELPAPDSVPLRVRLLGEDLIAFRTSSGAAGLIQNACPHRGASMFFGRNEEDGLRCVYHGWKFDVTGACVDMPSEPAESNFRNKVRTKAYPCIERNGIIWTYMGPEAALPPLPDIESNLIEADSGIEYPIRKVLRECNWIQALEGDVDTSHFGFLHRNFLADPAEGSFQYYMEKDRTPRYNVIETDIGTTYGAYRPAEADSYYWRIAHYLFPFYTMIPTGTLGQQVLIRAWIPIDDENTMFWTMAPPAAAWQSADGARRVALPGGAISVEFDYLPDTTDWLGKFRLRPNVANDYFLDRDSQREKSYTGITTGGAYLEDQAVTESMGAIYERTHEHLGTSDAMVIRTRRRMLKAARDFAETGAPPPGAHEPGLYRLRSGGIVLPRSADWLQATVELLHPKVEPGVPVEQIGA